MIEEYFKKMREQPALSDVLIAGLSKGLNLKECRHFKPKKTRAPTTSLGDNVSGV